MRAAHPPQAARKLLVLDAAFTLEAIEERGLQFSVTCRDLDGFFEHVWSVHPFATLLTSASWGPRWGRPDIRALSPRHTVIEGRVGRFAILRRLFLLNFILGQWALFRMLRGLIRREGIGVVRAGDPLYLGLLGWALARSCGIPLVVRVGGNHDKVFASTGRPVQPRLMRTRAIERRVERFVLSRADLVAGANQDNLDFALRAGARLERSTLFRYGNLIDQRHFAEPRSRPLDPARLTELGLRRDAFLLYVGRLVAQKHPDDIVRVLARLRGDGLDVKAVLSGDGPLRDDMAALARRLGVGDALVFAGNRDQAWLAEMIPAAGAVLSPHTGRALSEAALGGAPIVAYDIDWQGELVETGRTGILVPLGDWQGMAEGAHRLLTDREFARRMGDAARTAALAMLDPAALDAHERTEYRRLLDRFATASGIPEESTGS